MEVGGGEGERWELEGGVGQSGAERVAGLGECATHGVDGRVEKCRAEVTVDQRGVEELREARGEGVGGRRPAPGGLGGAAPMG